MKFAFIAAKEVAFPVIAMCRMLDVSCSGYYAWKMRPEPVTKTADVKLALAIAGVALAAWLSMRFAEVIHRVLTDNGVELLTRIAGLLLSAIAVQLVAESALAFAAQAK